MFLGSWQYHGSVHYFRIWKPWKCSLVSESDNPGSVHCFRIWKPWRCSLFSDLKTLEVFTIFGFDIYICIYARIDRYIGINYIGIICTYDINMILRFGNRWLRQHFDMLYGSLGDNSAMTRACVWLMFDEIKSGGSGRRTSLVKQGGWRTAKPRKVFCVCVCVSV